MEKNEEVSVDLYVKKRKVLFVIVTSFLIYCVFNVIFLLISEVRDLFINLIYMMSSTMALLISNSVLKIYYSTYKIKMSIFYEVIAIYSIVRLVPKAYIYDCFFPILYNPNSNYTNWAFLLLFICIRLYSSQQGKECNILLFIVGGSFILTDIVSIFFENGSIYTFLNVLIIGICMVIIGELKNVKLVDKKRINIIYLLINFIFVFVLLNIMYFYIGAYRNEIGNLIDVAVFIVYNASIMILIDKLLSTPYKILFSDLYAENVEMDKLNNEVSRKNKALEFSQISIRKKEKLFKELFAKVPVPLAMISKNGRIIYANTKFQELLEEISLKNIVNKKIFSIITPNEDIKIKDVINNKMLIINGVLKKDNIEKIIDMKFIYTTENNEEVIILFSDLTYKIKMEEFKMEIENNKLQEKIKRDFLSNISHDLKTPINVIYSAIQLNEVFIKNRNIESLKKYNLICKSNCITLIRLTNNLIDSSKIYSNYLSPNLCVKNIVETLEEMFMSLVEYAKDQGIDLIFDTNSEEVYMKFDEEFMQRIVINLVSNALKFTKAGGCVEACVVNSDDNVRIYFRDTGIGMEKKFIEEAFNRYSMEDEDERSHKERGSGIGLFVVKKLVESQNGTIHINSKRNKGTEIELLFNKEN